MALHGGLSFCKTQQVVGFDCAGIERLSVPQPNSCQLTGRAYRSPALSQARRGPTHPVTVMFYGYGHPDAGSHVAKAWFVPTLHARRP